MSRHWTFGQKLGLGFAVVVALTIGMASIAIYALSEVVEEKDQVINVNAENMLRAQRMRAGIEGKVSAVRGYLLTGDAQFLEEIRSAEEQLTRNQEALEETISMEAGRRALEELRTLLQRHDAAVQRVVGARTSGADVTTAARLFAEQINPARIAVEDTLDAFLELERARLNAVRDSASRTSDMAVTATMLSSGFIVIIAGLVALLLTRTLTRQIGNALSHVQSSTTELHAAATQQATGAKEQATAMSEISTTISELLATSRQIAESAERVAQIADGTSQAAARGEQTVERSHQQISETRRQIDALVERVLDLGKKSQQIGGVVDVVAELADQTNILAINATIEAAGAGDDGRRFAAVAEEIRKLADRVGVSTKEIRLLIEDVRGAVNSTVMTTEAGSKAVEAGSKEFAEVTAAFRHIAELISTTTEASREIELSTRQQATAVEQVKGAIASVAQATRESESASRQTQQTASQLSQLSLDLARLIHAGPGRAA